MKHVISDAIVLSRTDFGEADRIITFLTPQHGKVRGLARGVRKQKSKLAGGIELFSVSEISFLIGRGEINTLTSTRLKNHFSRIVKDLNRTNAGYELIKILNKATEENPEPAYFGLLDNAFVALDDPLVNLDLIQLWFSAQILKLSGHTPNLKTDREGNKLDESKTYHFDFDAMNFYLNGLAEHAFKPSHIKLLRLVFSNNSPQVLQKVQGVDGLAAECRPLVQSMLKNHPSL